MTTDAAPARGPVTTTVAGVDARDGVVEVRGSLTVDGDVTAGARIVAGGSLEVRGRVEGASVEGGRAVVIVGGARGATILAGVAAAGRRRAGAALGRAADELAGAADAARRVIAVAAARGRALEPRDAVVAVLAGHAAGLPASLAAARRAVSEAEPPPEGAAGSLVLAEGVVSSARSGGRAGPAALEAAAGAIARVVAAMDDLAGGPAAVRTSFLQRCTVRATGDVVLSGRGALETTIVAGGDVTVRAPGSTIRGGVVRARGVVVAHELGAPSGAGLRVVLDGPARGVRLVAGLAHAGVEVVCGGRLETIDAATLNLSLRFDEENRVTRSGTPAG